MSNITAQASAFFDQTIQVQWTVTNSGAGPTNSPQWKDRVFLDVVQTTSSTRLVATAGNVSALNAGESYTTAATFKIPRGYNGTYLLTVKTDTDAVLNEENAGNNILTRSIQIEVPPLPDLIVDNVQVPVAETFAGQEMVVSYSVRNQGTAAAGNWRDRVYLSRDTTFNPAVDRLIFTTNGLQSGLAAGATRTLTTVNRISGTTNPIQYETMRIPSDVSGLWYVFVFVDSTDQVYEFTDENNNVNYDPTQPGAPLNILVTPPDLVVPAAVTAPATASSGQTIVTSFTVRNQGAFNARPNLSHAVYLSTDQTFDAADQKIGVVRDNDVFEQGTEHPFTTSVKIPNCLANGTYYLFAVADSANEQFELDPGFDAEANNASPPKSIQLTTLPVDLRVANVQYSPITAPGDAVAVSWTVTNTGTGQASGSWNDSVVLVSSNPAIPSARLTIVARDGGLAGGASYTATANLRLPAYMEGEYLIRVTTDYTNSLPECGAAEDNNATDSAPFTVRNNLPDLVIDSVAVPPSVVAGQTFAAQWTERNANGAMRTDSPAWRDYVFISTDTTLSGDDRHLADVVNTAPLASAQTASREGQINTGNIAAGNYYLLVVADGGRHVYEGAPATLPESNNVRASSMFTVTVPGVDFQVGNVTVTPPFYSGANVGVSWTVTNAGTTPTLGAVWTDYVVLSRDQILDPTDTVLGYRAHNGVVAGAAGYTVNANMFIPNGLTGDYHVFVVTDYQNAIVENDNSNNTNASVALELTLTPPADLYVTAVTPPANVSPGRSADFGWTVQNSGSNAVLGRWRDTIYLSRDPFWDSGDIVVGQRDFDSQTTPVAAGATYSGITNVVVPPVEEGTYYVIVRTDAQNRIRESNEANNIASALAVTTVGITEIQMNTPFSTTLSNGGFELLKFTPPPLETVLLSLSTNIPNRSNELLTNFGTVATRSDFDFQGSRPGEGNQLNVIPETGEGDYYSLVRSDFVPLSFAGEFRKAPPTELPTAKKAQTTPPVPDQNITVKAQILPFSIRSVSPTEAGNEAGGPNEATPFSLSTKNGKSTLLLPRELRPVRVSRVGNKLTVAVEIEAQGDEVGTGFTLTYDPAVLGNPSNIAVGGGASGSSLLVNMATAGKIGVLLDRPVNSPLVAGLRTLLTAEFDVALGAPAQTLIGFDDSVVVKETVDGTAASLTTSFTSQTVNLLVPTAASVTVAGRVVSANERGAVTVTLTDAGGRSRSVRTTSFGFFNFTGVEAGQLYTLGAFAKGRSFDSQIVSVQNDVTDLTITENTP